MIKFKLKVLLAEREMTQSQLEAKTGIRQATISAIARGAAKHIPVSVLDRICDALQCQPGELMVYIPDKAGEPQQEVNELKQI